MDPHLSFSLFDLDDFLDLSGGCYSESPTPPLDDCQRFSNLLFSRAAPTPAHAPFLAPLVVDPIDVNQQQQGIKAYENPYGEADKFDILKLLALLPNRPNPKFALGVIDLSCAFLVTDPELPDNTIVYVSPSFEKLTKYSEKEIMGRNCRFLQSPAGNVGGGSIRTHCDNESVRHMRQCLDAEEECQVVVLNYSKSGVPFLNLVTMIPVRVQEKGGHSHLYVIGLQIDIGSKMFDRITQGPTQAQPPSRKRTRAEAEGNTDKEKQHQPLHRRLQAIQQPTYGQQALQEPERPLPGNPMQGVCLLNLDGTFLYVSPSAALLLEVFPETLLGHSFYEFLHPSDIQKAGDVHSLIKVKKNHERLTTNVRFSVSGGHRPSSITLDTMENPVTSEVQMVMYIS